jgi:hypothetical protein
MMDDLILTGEISVLYVPISSSADRSHARGEMVGRRKVISLRFVLRTNGVASGS